MIPRNHNAYAIVKFVTALYTLKINNGVCNGLNIVSSLYLCYHW